MSFILDIGSVESLITSADLRKLCPETVVQPTSAVIHCVTSHQLSLLGQTEIPIWLSIGRVVLIRFLVMLRGGNTSWPKSDEATVSKHHASD